MILSIPAAVKVFEKKAYPLGYSSYVQKYAEEYELDPNFIYAVIKTESSFNPKAISHVGARGLMQIMPETFDWINSRLKLSDITYDDMFDPEMNIRFGSYLYSVLLIEFDSYRSAVAAYHAGRGSVNKWLNDTTYSVDGHTLDKIPINDTAHYVDKILKAYERYKKIYL